MIILHIEISNFHYFINKTKSKNILNLDGAAHKFFQLFSCPFFCDNFQRAPKAMNKVANKKNFISPNRVFSEGYDCIVTIKKKFV